MDRTASETSTLVQTNLKARDGCGKSCNWSGILLKLSDVSVFHQCYFSHIKSYHPYRPTRIKDDIGSLRIAENIEFTCAVYISAGNSPAHEHDFSHQRNDRRVL